MPSKNSTKLLDTLKFPKKISRAHSRKKIITNSPWIVISVVKPQVGQIMDFCLSVNEMIDEFLPLTFRVGDWKYIEKCVWLTKGLCCDKVVYVLEWEFTSKECDLEEMLWDLCIGFYAVWSLFLSFCCASFIFKINWGIVCLWCLIFWREGWSCWKHKWIASKIFQLPSKNSFKITLSPQKFFIYLQALKILISLNPDKNFLLRSNSLQESHETFMSDKPSSLNSRLIQFKNSFSTWWQIYLTWTVFFVMYRSILIQKERRTHT